MTLLAKRFPAGRWSFLGPGSEKKWYSTYDSRPQGEWDRVAELMMIKFRESGHPVFRATSPLSRGTLKSKGGGQFSTHFCADTSPLSPGTLKSKGGGKFSIHFCADGDTVETVFRTAQLFLLISSVCTEQSQICVMNTVPVKQERGDPCWQDNLTHCSSQQDR